MTLASACASLPSSPLTDTFTTNDGVRVDYARCKIVDNITPFGYQFINLKLTVAGKVRVNPKFEFSRPGIDNETALIAKTAIRKLDDTFRWACIAIAEVDTANKVGLRRFHDEALAATIESVLALDGAVTSEEFVSEIKRANNLVLEFRRREPDSGDPFSGRPKPREMAN